MAKYQKKTNTLKSTIIILLIIVGCSIGLYFIMRYEKTSGNSNNTQSNSINDTKTADNLQDNPNLKYEYIEDTDVFKPQSTFGWEKPVITNYAWENGMYYEAFGNVDGKNAYEKYKKDLLSKGYKFIKEEKVDNTMMYTYSKDGLNVILGIQSNSFEITLSK